MGSVLLPGYSCIFRISDDSTRLGWVGGGGKNDVSSNGDHAQTRTGIYSVLATLYHIPLRMLDVDA